MPEMGGLPVYDLKQISAKKSNKDHKFAYLC